MWVSTRKKFCRGDEKWDDYISFIGLSDLQEVRSIDQGLNNYVNDCGSFECTWDNVFSALDMLPVPSSDNEYYLLIVDTSSEANPPSVEGWTLLGYDLSDETRTSSLLNCGPWKGALEPLTHRLNAYGLLSRQDARNAKEILPKEWGEQEPHAQVTIWALYERQFGV